MKKTFCILLLLALFFNNSIAMAVTNKEYKNGETIIESGMCGENLEWFLYDNGVLFIDGVGAMSDYEYTMYIGSIDHYYGTAPWPYDIKEVIIGDNVTYIGSYAFLGCKDLEKISLGKNLSSINETSLCVGCDKLENIFVSCDNQYFCDENGILYSKDKHRILFYPDGRTEQSFVIPNTVQCIEEGASIHANSVIVPESVIKLKNDAFSVYSGLKEVIFLGDIPEYVGSYVNPTMEKVFGWRYQNCKVYISSDAEFLNPNKKYIDDACIKIDDELIRKEIRKEEEREFIKTHLNYIEGDNNTTYHYLLNYCDLSKIALRDYSELKDTYDKWRLLRGSIFDNPYEVALAELIISEESVDGQMDSFSINLYSKQRSIINNVMKLINGKVSLTSDQKSKMEKLFSERNFDDATYQLCADILGNYVSEDELKTLFQTYDTSNKFMGLLGDGKKIVDSVVDVINYSSILQAYNETSDEFKEVLTLVDYYCQGENSELDYAITQYLLVADKSDINNQIIKKVVGNSIDVGKDLFEETILIKVRNFMIENMDLSNVAEATATKLLAVIEGMKIGYSLGTTIDNVLFNTDNVTDAYITAYASCKLAYYMKFALEDYAVNLTKNQTIENAELFCEAYNMYKHTQINVAENMIRYFASNEQSLIYKIFKSSAYSAYEAAIYQWQILKLNWDNAKCHDESVTYKNTKNITIACPVDIEIKDDSDNLILKVVDNAVTYNGGKAIATIRNNIKYITIPDDSYSVNIMATDTGKMNYSITNFSYLKPTETVNFENIQLEKSNTYIGAITEGENLFVQENALVSNGKTVESTSSVFKKNEKIDVNEIKFPKEDIELTVGSTEKLQAEILPETASVKTVTWFSSNPDVVTVDEYGTITALVKGNVTVYCSTLDGNVTSECKITVVDTGVNKKPGEEHKHKWDGGMVTRKATCMQKGLKTYTCILCKEKKAEETPQISHNYKTITKVATTSKNGSIVKKCTVCGTTKSRTIIHKIKSVSLKNKRYTYNGKNKKPSVTVKDSKRNKIKSKYYTLSYQNNKNVGKAVVVIRFRGNYTGTIKKVFYIVPKATSLYRITAGAKRLKITWKKQPKSTTGYQIQYSTSKKFAKRATVTKTIKKNSVTTLTVKKLKAKKTYYVRVRTYKTVKGKKYCSNWSKSKKVKTKK